MLHKRCLKFLSNVSALIFAGLLGLSVTPAFAAALQVDESGKLTGAKDVSVNGNLYDVEFAAGTFQSVFGSQQNYVMDLEFGRAATNALFEQVFIDGEFGMFDSDPNLTSGCEGISTSNYCGVMTPYALGLRRGVFSVWTIFTNNHDEDVNDNFAFLTWIDYNSSMSYTDQTWARWSVASSVPEPSNYAMMMLGLFSVILIAYRRQS